MHSDSDLDKVCERLRIKIDCEYGGVEVPDGWPPGTHPYKVHLRMDGRSLTTAFFCGPMHNEKPSAADVLSCLCSDALAGEQSFNDFCYDFGYDTDSRKAEDTWKKCRAMAPRLRRFLRNHFDEVTNASH